MTIHVMARTWHVGFSRAVKVWIESRRVRLPRKGTNIRRRERDPARPRPSRMPGYSRLITRTLTKWCLVTIIDIRQGTLHTLHRSCDGVSDVRSLNFLLLFQAVDW